MHDDGERVDRVAVEQDVELHQIRRPEVRELVVERRVTLRDRLEPVVEVDDDLGEREVEPDVHALAVILERAVLAPLLLGELVDRGHELRRHEDRRLHVRLVHLLDPIGARQLGRVVDVEHLTGRGEHLVLHARRRHDQRQVELALEALLDDLHVQHAEEPAAKAVAQRQGGLGLVGERRIIEPQLLEGVAQRLVVRVLDRVEPGEDHRLGVAIARERRGGGARGLGDRLADLRVGDALDRRGQVADLSGR